MEKYNSSLAHLIEAAQDTGYVVLDDAMLLHLEVAELETKGSQPHSEAARHLSFTARQRAIERLYQSR